MSLWKFLADLIAAVASIFKKMSPDMQKIVETAYNVTNLVKSVSKGQDVSSASIEELLSFVPEEQRQQIATVLPVVLKQLKLASENADSKEAILEAATNIAAAFPDAQKIHLDSIAKLLISIMADGKISWDELYALPKWIHDEFEGKHPAAQADEEGEGDDTDPDEHHGHEPGDEEGNG